MVSLDDLLGLIRQRPFVPFRIVMLDGATYVIRHPELVMPGAGSLVVGMNPNPQLPYYERRVTLALQHVVSLEPLAATVGENGAQTKG